MSAETVARTFVAGWIARFGVPSILTTDQGRQFESCLFTSLRSLLGIQRVRTSPYHPSSNGLVERFHRTLKQALRCHNPTRWTETLPIVLLGLRSTLKDDFDGTCAEMVYGTTLRLPGEFIDPNAKPTQDPSNFLQQLRLVMQELSPVPTTHHSSHLSKVFYHPALETCSHVFLRNDCIKPSLSPTYDGPYVVVKRTNKNFTLDVSGREVVVNVDRVKPAFLSQEDRPASPGIPVAPTTSTSTATTAATPPSPSVTAAPSTILTRSGRTVRFNPRYL